MGEGEGAVVEPHQVKKFATLPFAMVSFAVTYIRGKICSPLCFLCNGHHIVKSCCFNILVFLQV